MTYTMMLLTVTFSDGYAFVSKVFLKSGIDNKLLANRVSSKLPGELIPIPCLVVVVSGIDHFIVIFFELAMILGYCCRYG
jgi:hypothetical protein